MFNIVFCSGFSLKDLIYFLYDVGRLLFWRSFDNCNIEDIFLDLLMKFSLRINSLIVKKVFHTCRM